jgi:hypothetical protein
MVGSAWVVGSFLLALASLFSCSPVVDDSPSRGMQTRRLGSKRHARDEIDWPEGNERHARRDRESAEAISAREELHRCYSRT